jgi:hypothetical protein
MRSEGRRASTSRTATARSPGATSAGRVRSACAATASLLITSAYGRPLALIAASAASSTAAASGASAGNRAHGISIVSSSAVVIRPICSCCGSSASPPGSPRCVTTRSTGTRNG